LILDSRRRQLQVCPAGLLPFHLHRPSHVRRCCFAVEGKGCICVLCHVYVYVAQSSVLSMLISLVVPVEHRYRETRGGTQWSFEVVFPSLIGGAVAIRGTHGERALVFHCHPHFLDVPGDSSGHPWISGGAGAVEIGGTLCSVLLGQYRGLRVIRVRPYRLWLGSTDRLYGFFKPHGFF
jgi:hypothetical protein